MKYIKFILIVLFLSCSFVYADSIPKMYLYGDLNNMTSKDDIRYLEVRYDGNISFDAYASLKIQGASSAYAYEKKGYNIVFYTNSNYDSKKKVNLGFGSQSKYTLKAEWTDKSHSRNVVNGKIISNIQQLYGLFVDTPNNGVVDGFPIEVYLNDKFYGLYSLTIPKDWMYNLDKNNKNHIAIMAKDYDKQTTFNQIATNNWKSFEVEVGEQNDYSLARFNRLIRFIKNSSFEDFKNNFSEYLDLDAMLNYYCFMMYAELYDNVNKNFMFVTYDGSYWYISLYDLDVSYGTSWSGNELLDYRDMFDTYIGDSQLWSKFEKVFSNEIAKRYEELRGTYLNKNYVMKHFNSYYNSIPKSSLELEDAKWGVKNGYPVTQISNFLDVRTPILDAYIESLKTDEYDKLYGDKIEEPEKAPSDNNIHDNVNQNQSSNNVNSDVENKPPVVDTPLEEDNVEEDKIDDENNNNSIQDDNLNDDVVNDGDLSVDETVMDDENIRKDKNFLLIILSIIIILIIGVIIILKKKSKDK